MTDLERLEFARERAQDFSHRTLAAIGRVLDQHSAAVIEFAVEMQRRVDAAEALLAEVATSRRGPRRNAAKEVRHVSIHVDLLARIDHAVSESKARPE